MSENGVAVLKGDVTATLKRSKFETLYQKDTWDLFSSLMLAIKLTTQKKLGFINKGHQNSFLGSDAVSKLATLKFIRSPDPKDPFNVSSSHMVNIPEASAKKLLQQFVDGSLLRDPTTAKETIYFAKNGVYTPTFKGLRVLEEFIQACHLETEADHLAEVLASQPMPRPKLIRFNRAPANDEIILTLPVLLHLFRNLVGRFPNYTYVGYRDNHGVLFEIDKEIPKLLKEVFKKDARPFEGKINTEGRPHCVVAPRLIHWLCDNTAISCPQEAAEIVAHFVRMGLLVFISILGDAKKATVTRFKVLGDVPRGITSTTDSGEFLYSQRSVYAVTIDGTYEAGWPGSKDLHLAHLASLLDAAPPDAGAPPHEEPLSAVNATRLRKFLNEPEMLALFRMFLRDNRCENDLTFYTDVEDFKAEFDKAREATPLLVHEEFAPVEGSSAVRAEPATPTPRPHETLANRPFLIYNTYFTPSSRFQLSFNIGKDLKEELERALEHCVEFVTNQILIVDSGNPGAGESTTLNIDQLAILVWLFERVQQRVFCQLADVQIPKFLKWPQFLASRIESVSVSASKSSSPTTPTLPEPVEVRVDKGKRRADE